MNKSESLNVAGSIREYLDLLSDKMLLRGFSRTRIKALRAARALPPVAKDPFVYHVAKAFFYAAQFSRAVKNDEWPSAAYHSLDFGRSMQAALDHEAQKFPRDWARYFKGKNTADKNAALRTMVEAKIKEHRGIASAKSVHDWLSKEPANFRMQLGTFKNWWTAAGMRKWTGEYRKTVTSGLKRDLQV